MVDQVEFMIDPAVSPRARVGVDHHASVACAVQAMVGAAVLSMSTMPEPALAADGQPG